MTENKTETFEGVDSGNVHKGDRLQFMTRETGFNGRGLYSRTGVVVKVTEKTVRVACDAVGHASPEIAVLRRHVPDWVSRDVRRVVTEQRTATRTAADFPKGTRVTSADGQTGTVNGSDIGRVTNTEHANYGREYIGVTWDPTESIPWGQRNRPFVDELTVTAAADTDEAPFQPGERVVHADGRCFTFVGVNPEDSSRILVARPTDERVVSWLLTDCRAENETEIAASHGETVRLHRATCGGHAGCARHGIEDRRGGQAIELGTIPTCESGVIYGAWSEGGGGFVYSGVDCATDAANWAADELRQLANDDDTDKFEILAICRDHEDQPANGCEECATEGCGAVDADDLDACGHCADCTGRN
jgi:hypothetical protein